jgi:hypothetical protein
LGSVTKSPNIQTNEGPPARNITIKCDVVRAPDSTFPVVLQPYRISVSRAGSVEIDEGKASINNVSDQDLQVKVIDEPPGYFKIEPPKVIKKGTRADLKLKVNKQYLDETFEKSITLEFNDPAKSRFTIPVVRRLIGQQAADNHPATHPEPVPTKPDTVKK